MSKVLFAAALCASAVISGGAHAGNVIVNFDAVPLGTHFNNLTTQGIDFSPSCHYDLGNTTDGGWTPASNWLGFDLSGCLGGIKDRSNPDFLGGAAAGSGARMFVAGANGNLISLKSFKFVSGSDSYGYNLYSSKGGLGHFDYGGGNNVTYEFDGPEWNLLDWLVFDAGAPGEPVGFDDLRLIVHQVDEPGWLLFLGLGLIAMRARSASKRR